MPTEIHREADEAAGRAWDGWGWSEPITPAAAEREARDAALSDDGWQMSLGTLLLLMLVCTVGWYLAIRLAYAIATGAFPPRM